MEFVIKIKDINKLGCIDVAAIMSRLSWPDSGSDSSIQKELTKRYLHVEPGLHPEMALALIWCDDVLAGWVGTRPWTEKFKGRPVVAQTVECFVDPEYRRRGIAKMGLLALLAANKIDKTKIVSVYAPNVVKLAQQCGCTFVIYCETDGR
jgi:GNAT superfamily N-acetyltransferase